MTSKKEIKKVDDKSDFEKFIDASSIASMFAGRMEAEASTYIRNQEYDKALKIYEYLIETYERYIFGRAVENWLVEWKNSHNTISKLLRETNATKQTSKV